MKFKTTITPETAAKHHIKGTPEFVQLFVDATRGVKIPVYAGDTMPVGYAENYDPKENEVEFTSTTNFLLPDPSVMRPDFKGQIINGEVKDFKLICFTMIPEPRIEFAP